MDPELIALLRADLEAAEYRAAAVTALLGEESESARQRGVFAPARRALDARDSGQLEHLIRLFLLGESLPVTELELAFPRLGVDGAARLGLIAPDFAQEQAAFRAALSLNPVSVADPVREEDFEWWILSDLDDQLRGGPATPDHVMGVGGATRSLIAQLPPAAVRSSLDLGTGCGIVALHLAQRGPVIATDLSERALTLARANAQLNGVDGVKFRQGDLFAPVSTERFELIASNPPFVVTPRGSGDERYTYRDGGMVGDALAERVVREGPLLLAQGGTLLCLANWESPWGVDALERVRGWISDDRAELQGDRLAGWVMERDRVSTARYAETWARDGGARPGESEFDRLMDAWLDDFAERRIVAIGLGSIRIRRVSAAVPINPGRDLVFAERAGGPLQDRPGTALAEIFDASIRAELMSDAEVLAAHWVIDPSVVEERQHVPGAADPSAISLSSPRGVARQVTADTLLAAAVGACDGELSLAVIADALATLLETDPEATAEALVAGVRELTRMGMLSPAVQQG